MDQVRKKKITIDGDKLESLLGIKVIFTEANKKRQIRDAMEEAAQWLLDRDSASAGKDRENTRTDMAGIYQSP